MVKTKFKTYNFYLPYHKQGDDLAFYLGLANRDKQSPTSALEGHALMLEEAAERLRQLKRNLSLFPEQEWEIDADCHCIFVHCSEELGKSLCEKELLYPSFEDEDDDEEDMDSLEKEENLD